MDVDITAGLAHIVDAIETAGTETDVTADPAKVRLPGILVQFVSVALDTLDGYTHNARVVVIGQDRDDPRAIEQLQSLLNVALAADLAVSGPITPAGIRLPGQPSPMPALVIPVRVHQE